MGWARTQLGDADGVAQFRGHGKLFISQGSSGPWRRCFTGGSRNSKPNRCPLEEALTSIDRAIELAREGDIRHINALAAPPPRRHPCPGAIPTNPAPRRSKPTSPPSPSLSEQGARSFGLLAALKLAKVYQSTARPVDAHDILAPALEGFAPTPEMPEIAEGQALLAALLETDRVKVAAASRERRLKLQTSYSQAMAWSKGYANEETKAVLAQTERLDGPERQRRPNK